MSIQSTQSPQAAAHDHADQPVMTNTISACILTHRADTQFEVALESVRHAGEILILDNESGGEWERFKHTYPQLRVIPLPGRIEDFGAARRVGVAHATLDWVLFIDSDEVVPESAWAVFDEVLKSGASGASIIRTDVFLGRELRFSEGGAIRLVRLAKKSQLQITGRVHESLQVVGHVIATDTVIAHFAHDSLSNFLHDIAWYAQLAASEKHTGRIRTLLELLVYPPAKFFVSLIFNRGILDGWRGVVYATCMSIHSLAVRIYRYETLLQK
jgi:glycosyltransferase involved in cell wall biosynthesis